MRGQEKLIEMRKARKVPQIVFVNDYPCQTDWFETGDHVTLCTAGDDVLLLDLRCLIGLRVSVSSPNETRARSLAECCKAAGAATVAACHVQERQHACDQAGWAEIWHRAEGRAA